MPRQNKSTSLEPYHTLVDSSPILPQTQRSEVQLQTRIRRQHKDTSYVTTAASASTQRNAGQAFVSDTMGSRAPDKNRYTLHTGVVQNLRQSLSFVLVEILCLLLFQQTSTWRFSRTNIVFVLQQCIHPPNGVFVHMNEEPPLHLADESDTPTQAHKETGVCPYLHVKLGELTRLSFVVEDKQCPSSHRRATQSLWQRKHSQWFPFLLGHAPWPRRAVSLYQTRMQPLPLCKSGMQHSNHREQRRTSFCCSGKASPQGMQLLCKKIETMKRQQPRLPSPERFAKHATTRS